VATADKVQHGPPTYNEIRLYNMADTAISAGLLGGGLNLVRRKPPSHINQCSVLMVYFFHAVGPRGLLPGVVTATLACSTLQLFFNEARVTRIKWMYDLSHKDLAARRAHPMAVQPEATPTLEPIPTPSEIPPKPTSKTWSDRALGALSYVIPLSRIPDEQFLGDLHRRKVEVDRELEETQKQLAQAQLYAGRHDAETPAMAYEGKK
jgi:hypothetical protein